MVYIVGVINVRKTQNENNRWRYIRCIASF